MRQKILIAVSLCLIGFTGYRLWASNLLRGHGDRIGKTKVLDIESGHRFYLELYPGFKWPAKSPKTGQKTGYPVEVCYWYECGKKKGGTWVVLNSTLRKEGPTNCPVCGHQVVGHNPLPPGTKLDRDGNLITVAGSGG